ncbi:NADPH cytochrome p450 reductase [Spraguea lophii 42_110]|uniref:NADPH cytochrome p450 reductase n=1 Tax=Spraguea lophii (strain 42_110) TaxID=1358809 RepID=S7XVJ4_SPRLO|nr:NADPH cytochrome p450 reductase [Spraguea lophii 42_110]
MLNLPHPLPIFTFKPSDDSWKENLIISSIGNDLFQPVKILDNFLTFKNIFYNNISKANINKIEKLSTTWKKVYKVELDSTLSYNPGDSVGIIVSNREIYVNEIFKILNIKDRSIEIKIKDKKSKEFKIVYRGLISDYFRNVFSFTEIPKKSFLKAIIECSEEKEIIKFLVSKEGSKKYFELLKYNLIEILTFLKAKPTLEHLVYFANNIKPRYYSLTNEDKNLEFYIGVENTEHIKGHCSSFFDNIYFNSKTHKEKHVYVLGVKKNEFFNLRKSKKYLFISCGIGITPFISFSNHIDNYWVIHGTRSKQDDLTTHLRKKGEITTIISKHERIENFIKNELVGDFIKENCLLYICGPIEMQKKVYNTIKEFYNFVLNEKRVFFDSWL